MGRDGDYTEHALMKKVKYLSPNIYSTQCILHLFHLIYKDWMDQLPKDYIS